jgi:hypothetical protein
VPSVLLAILDLNFAPLSPHASTKMNGILKP